MIRVLLGEAQKFPASELEDLIGKDIDYSYLQRRVDEINEQQCASANGRRLIIQKAVESDTEADYRLYTRPCARAYASISLPDSEERRIGDYIVSFRHGMPYQIRRKISKYLTETLYFVAWDTQQERELQQYSGEIFNENLAGVSDEAGDTVKRIKVLRGDLPEGRHLLEKLGITPNLHRTAEEIAARLIIINDTLSSLAGGGAKIFNESMKIALELFSPCRTQEDYLRKIGALANLFQVETRPLRNLVTSPDPSWGTIKLIQEWFNEKDLKYDSEIFKVWRSIVALRNSTFPYHSGDSRVVDIVQFFRLDFPPDYCRLWENILLMFYRSIVKFFEALKLFQQRCQP